MRFSFSLLFVLTITFSLSAEETIMYRLAIKDKGNTPYSINKPEAFLSQKSIDRRLKQNYQIDETDLPIDPAYFKAIVEAGASIQTYSKWVNTIVVNIPNCEVQNKIMKLPFVEGITKVWSGDLSQWNEVDEEIIENQEVSENDYPRAINFQPEDYGDTFSQIEINNAFPLHELGYRGSGKTIAVIDGGFSNVDKYPDFFDSRRILGVKNFTHQKGNPYRIAEGHGTMVFSCLAANNPEKMIGSAPLADYYLFKTEIGKEEYPVEEDYWIAALEYADSVGVDIVTTSLGYFYFDDSSMNHTWDKLDGHTIPASRAASMAIQKGMLLFNSAGNEGDKTWEKVTVPGDAKHSLTVGAIRNDSTWVSFSSWGYIADNRMKPDVVALGNNVCVLRENGQMSLVKGTSFATPILAGMTACLWEALPSLKNIEIIELIKKSSDKYTQPDEYVGYGIPNIFKAYENAEILLKDFAQ